MPHYSRRRQTIWEAQGSTNYFLRRSCSETCLSSAADREKPSSLFYETLSRLAQFFGFPAKLFGARFGLSHRNHDATCPISPRLKLLADGHLAAGRIEWLGKRTESGLRPPRCAMRSLTHPTLVEGLISLFSSRCVSAQRCRYKRSPDLRRIRCCAQWRRE
jgi:hypothetical protein